jgi:hypothetical protein
MKTLVVILISLLFLSNGFWLYQIVDNGITSTYKEASFEMTTKMLDQTVLIANKNIIGTSLEQAKTQFPKDVYGLEPFVKDGCLVLGQVCLKLNSNNIIIGVDIGVP